MIHWTSIPCTPPVADPRDWLHKKMTEAIVSLYRQSQMLEETGRLFLLHKPNIATGETEIGLLRTDDPAQIGGLQMFYSGAHRELKDNEVLLLFEAS